MNQQKQEVIVVDGPDEQSKEQWSEWVENAVKWNEYRCYKQNVPEGCHQLADYLRRFRNEKEKALDLYQKNCIDNKHAPSCDTAGKLFYGKSGGKTSDKAIEFLDKGCTLKDGECCFNAAVYRLTQNEKASAMKYLEKACDVDHVEGCCMLSGYYIKGIKELPNDMEKAFKLAKKACDLNSGVACRNLSVMYNKGKGVEQDLALAEKYGEKAARLFGWIDDKS